MIFEGKKSRGQEVKQKTNKPSPLVGERIYGRTSETSLDCEQIEHTVATATFAKLCERGVNPRQSVSDAAIQTETAPTSILPHKGGSITPSLMREGWDGCRLKTHTKSSKKAAFTLAEVFLLHFAGRRKIAFTLAEVLITLGIIGIVAAMTMPALITKFQQVIAVNRLKQTYSIINQGIHIVDMEFGTSGMSGWSCPNYQYGDYGMTRCFGLIFDKVAVSERYGQIGQNGTMCGKPGKSYPNYPTAACTNSYSVRLKNGACVAYAPFYWCGGEGGKIVIDIDGPDAGANKLGRDMFVFVYGWGNNQQNPVVGNGKIIVPDGMYQYSGGMIYKTHSQLVNDCRQNKRSCANLIMQDGWQMKKDYPW